MRPLAILGRHRRHVYRESRPVPLGLDLLSARRWMVVDPPPGDAGHQARASVNDPAGPEAGLGGQLFRRLACRDGLDVPLRPAAVPGPGVAGIVPVLDLAPALASLSALHGFGIA